LKGIYADFGLDFFNENRDKLKIANQVVFLGRQRCPPSKANDKDYVHNLIDKITDDVYELEKDFR